MKESLEVLDTEGFKTGEILSRELIHQLGYWHKEIAICIVNSKREFLMQRRSLTRKMKPGEWTWAAGHVDPHELPIHTALRELEEEIGIKFKPTDLKYVMTLKDIEFGNNNLLNRRNLDTYLLKTDVTIDEMTLQEEEVAEVKWFPEEEYKKRFLENDSVRKQVYEEILRQHLLDEK